MARKRMIDPSIWQSEDFSKLSYFSRLVFIGLFSNADDEGRGRANPAFLKSAIFPYDDGLRVADIEKSLNEIAAHMSTTFYTHDEKEYYTFDHWADWQKIDRATQSKFPAPEDGNIVRRRLDEGSTNTRRGLAPNRKEKEQEQKEKLKEQETLRAYADGDTELLHALLDFEAMRKAIKKPLTERAKQLLCNSLDKLAQQGENRVACLNQSILHNWQAVYAVKQEEKNAGNARTSFDVYNSGRYDYDEIEALARQKLQQAIGKDG